MRFVLVALTPGSRDTANPAPKEVDSDIVITLWYSDGHFKHDDNADSYERLRNICQQYIN